MNIPDASGQRRIIPGDITSIDPAHQGKPSKGFESAATAGQQPEIGYQPDSKLSSLLSQLNQQDQVRKDLISQAKQQLDSGELLNRETAETTAASILGIVEHF